MTETTKENYLIFEQTKNVKVIAIWNKDKEHLGWLEKIRVGRWESWCLLLNEGCYLSASCQDEVREKTRQLNSRKDIGVD